MFRRRNNGGNVLPPGTITQKANTIKKGCFILIKDKPCEVDSVKTTRSNHCKFVAYDIANHVMYEDSVRENADCVCPKVRYTMYMIRNISSEGMLTVSDANGHLRGPLMLPSVLPKPHVRDGDGANRDCNDDCESDCEKEFVPRHIGRLLDARKLFAVVRSVMGVEQVLGIETMIIDPPEAPPSPLE